MISKNDDPRKSMKVPEGFFEDFENRLMENIGTETKPPLTIWRRIRFSAVAAILLLVLGAMYILRMNAPSSGIELADVSLEQNWEYLIENSEDITYEDLASFEESEEVIQAIEHEIYGDIDDQDLFDQIDLQTIENYYK